MHGPMTLRMHTQKGTRPMTDRMHAAEANGMAGEARARVRVYVPCQASPAVWSPIYLGFSTKHGRPRRHEVSHP
jgi:hypothetical protein